MLANLTPQVFIQAMVEPKNRAKITIKDIKIMIEKGKTIKRLIDKGMFILLIAELLNRQVINYQISLTKFRDNIEDPKEKRIRVRNDENQPPRRRRANRPKEIPIQNGITIEEISNESRSNPSNVEFQRMNQQLPAFLKSGDEKSSSNGNNSKGSKDSKDLAFKNQLYKITEMGGEETYPHQISDDQFGNFKIQEDDKSQSSSGYISNMAEKMKLLGIESLSLDQTLPTKRRNGERGQRGKGSTTTKKKTSSMIPIKDEVITMEETRIMYSDGLNESKLSVQAVEKVQIYQEFKEKAFKSGDGFFDNSQDFQPEMLIRMKNFLISDGLNVNRGRQIDQNEQPHENNFQTDFTNPNIQSGSSPFTQFTPFPTISQMENYSQFQRQKIPVTAFQGKIEMKELSKKAKKKTSDAFYEMLLRCQSGQITMQQEDPLHFGNIYIQINVS